MPGNMASVLAAAHALTVDKNPYQVCRKLLSCSGYLNVVVSRSCVTNVPFAGARLQGEEPSRQNRQLKATRKQIEDESQEQRGDTRARASTTVQSP